MNIPAKYGLKNCMVQYLNFRILEISHWSIVFQVSAGLDLGSQITGAAGAAALNLLGGGEEAAGIKGDRWPTGWVVTASRGNPRLGESTGIKDSLLGIYWGIYWESWGIYLLLIYLRLPVGQIPGYPPGKKLLFAGEHRYGVMDT